MFTMWKIYHNYDNLTKIAPCINYVKFANISLIMNEKLLMLEIVCDESRRKRVSMETMRRAGWGGSLGKASREVRDDDDY